MRRSPTPADSVGAAIIPREPRLPGLGDGADAGSGRGLSPGFGRPLAPRWEAAVICVTYNSAGLLAQFAAAAARGLEGLRSTIVLVDSGSQDDTVAVARMLLPDAGIVELGANRGYAAGINAGVARLRSMGGSETIVVMNPDVLLDRRAVTTLHEGLRQPGVGIAVPALKDEDGVLQLSLRRPPSAAATWLEAILGGPLAGRLHLPTEVDWNRRRYESDRGAAWATGGMMAISSACLDAVGEWEESFFLYEEEVDFCLRAADAGFHLRYVAAAGATRMNGTAPTEPWVLALMRVNRVTLVKRRRSPRPPD